MHNFLLGFEIGSIWGMWIVQCTPFFTRFWLVDLYNIIHLYYKKGQNCKLLKWCKKV